MESQGLPHGYILAWVQAVDPGKVGGERKVPLLACTVGTVLSIPICEHSIRLCFHTLYKLSFRTNSETHHFLGSALRPMSLQSSWRWGAVMGGLLAGESRKHSEPCLPMPGVP